MQGHKDFNDYPVFMRAMAVAMSGYEGDKIEVFSLGPINVNQFVAQFCNISEDGMRGRGMSIRFYTRPYSWAKDYIGDMNYVAYLAGKPRFVPPVIKLANEYEVENGIFLFG